MIRIISMIPQQAVGYPYGYGHAKTEHKMNLPAKGERVFVFVNRIGIIAIGKVIGDSAIQSDAVFADKRGDEYHREVRWLHKIESSRAITSSECSQWGYNLPIRCTIGKISNGNVASIIEKELIEREKV